MTEHPFDRYTGLTDVAALKQYTAQPLRKCIRVNTLKWSLEELQAYAAAESWQLEPVPWCRQAFFVDREVREQGIGKDLLHLLGLFYVQEASSMLPPELLDVQPGDAVLDMAAAPGSKTTQMAAMQQGRGVIVANDVQPTRLRTLKTALHRCGVTNAVVNKRPGQWYARHMTERFDRVLCDAPCTAQGTARKDPDALTYCSVQSIRKAAGLQKDLLESAIHAAKVGGRIVYSTCTLTPEENEEVVAHILEKFGDAVRVIDPRETPAQSEHWNMDLAIEDSLRVQRECDLGIELPLLRIWPQTYDSEGFFCAVLEKQQPTCEVEWMEWRHFQGRELSRRQQRDIAQYLEKRYGVPLVHDNEHLLEREGEVVLTTSDVLDFRLPVTPYSVGLPFGKLLKDQPIYIDHDIATLRGSAATANVADIDDEQLQELLNGQDCACNPELFDHVLVRYNGLCIGRGRAKNGTLKNHLPRWLVLITQQ